MSKFYEIISIMHSLIIIKDVRSESADLSLAFLSTSFLTFLRTALGHNVDKNSRKYFSGKREMICINNKYGVIKMGGKKGKIHHIDKIQINKKQKIENKWGHNGRNYLVGIT